jgi:hypothetical protein
MLLLSLAVALVVSSAAVAVYSAGSYPGGPVFMVPLLAVYSAASSRPRNRSVPLVSVAALAVVVTGLLFDRSGGGSALIALVYLGWTAAALLLGEAARARHEYVVGVPPSQRDGHEASPRVEPVEPMASVELARSTSSGQIASPRDVGRVVHRLRTLLRSGDAPVGIRNVRARGYSADLTAPR